MAYYSFDFTVTGIPSGVTDIVGICEFSSAGYGGQLVPGPTDSFGNMTFSIDTSVGGSHPADDPVDVLASEKIWINFKATYEEGAQQPETIGIYLIGPYIVSEAGTVVT